MVPPEHNQSHKRRSKHAHADRLKSLRHSMLTDTKRVLQEIVDDSTVSIEEFRLMCILTGATLDCFFRIDDTKKVAVPLQTKADIIKQILYTDRRIRHSQAKASPSHTRKHAGGMGIGMGMGMFTNLLWDNRERFMKLVLTNAFPALMTALGVPPQAQSMLRHVLENMIESLCKTKSNSQIIDAKEKKIDALVKEIEENDDIKDIDLDAIQQQLGSEVALVEEIKKNLGRKANSQKLGKIPKGDFAEDIHNYTSNIVNGIVRASQIDDTTEGDQNDMGNELEALKVQYYKQQLKASQKKTEVKSTISSHIKKKSLDNVIKFLQVILQVERSKKKYKGDQSKQNKWLDDRIEYIKKDIKNPLFHSATKYIKSHPLGSLVVVGALSMFTYMQMMWLLKEDESQPEETFDEETATPEQLRVREQYIKAGVQKIMRNVKTRHLLTSVPVLLCVLFVAIKRHALGEFSDILAGTAKPKTDKVMGHVPKGAKSYADVDECLRKVDPTLHHSFHKCKTTEHAYYILCNEQYDRRNNKLKRSILNEHLFRKDGTLRGSVAEVAVAVKKIYKHSNVFGRLDTKRRAVLGIRTTRRSSSGNSKIRRHSKKKKMSLRAHASTVGSGLTSLLTNSSASVRSSTPHGHTTSSVFPHTRVDNKII